MLSLLAALGKQESKVPVKPEDISSNNELRKNKCSLIC